MDMTPSTVIPSNPARALTRSFPLRVMAFVLAHVPLAFLLMLSPWIATLYGLVVLLFGLHAAVVRKSDRVMVTLGYIAGFEILWRMSAVYLPWEFGKYASVLILVVALLMEWRVRPRTRPFTFVPLFYFLLLLPAVIPTFLQLGLDQARDDASFNLAGHLALALMALYFWQRPLNRRQAVKLLIGIMAPIAGTVSLAIVGTLQAELAFALEANFLTSAGYGPNQFSNLLSLGAFAGVILYTLLPKSPGTRLFVLTWTVIFVVQALLTFSRGGVYSLALAILALGVHLLRDPRVRWRFILLLGAVYLLGMFFVLPSLNEFTDGLFELRFTDLNTTGRLEAAQADLQAFIDNPLTGAGVGFAEGYRQQIFGRTLAAHTEFTRMLAEHGALGLISLVLLIWMLLRRYIDTSPGINRAIVAACAVWATSVMMQSAMRIVAVSLVAALALIAWQVDATVDEDHGRS